MIPTSIGDLRACRYRWALDILMATCFARAAAALDGFPNVPEGTVKRAATLCRNPLVATVDGGPVFAACHHHLQINRDPDFSAMDKEVEWIQKV